MDIVILTPISLEYDITRNFLSNLKHCELSGLRCETGTFTGKDRTYKIGIVETGSKDANVAIATAQIIQQLKPSILLLLGICGGIKDVELGDVVVGTKAYSYEAGKETKDGFVARPESYKHDLELITLAKTINQTSSWLKRVKVDVTKKPNVVFGPIASGNKVIASTESIIYKRLKQHFNDTTAIEMEAAGFGEAIYRHQNQNIRALNIRGVSDLIDNKKRSDDEGTQPTAVHHAAAFVFELISKLDLKNNQLITNMNVKELTKGLMEFFIPILKLESVNQIGQEFKEATNNSIIEAWEKVRPLFITEIDDLKEDPKDAETLEESTIGMRKKLKKTLNENATLKADLERLLTKAKEEPKESKAINNHTNIIRESKITVNGDLRLGNDNITNNNSGQSVNNNKKIEKQININNNKGSIQM